MFERLWWRFCREDWLVKAGASYACFAGALELLISCDQGWSPKKDVLQVVFLPFFEVGNGNYTCLRGFDVVVIVKVAIN